ncbi:MULTISPECIES: poly-beta-1,6-N-acetyl-D-glucosamine N-deacetylase PgaB [Pasteurellaceae]|uniref:poly-beta-1,6-N-acetyl-D-glucosamine N-deacetylase PgaB n=1 Tax=Pasteurellaceae TaxID=712 RepID=UPI003567D89A
MFLQKLYQATIIICLSFIIFGVQAKNNEYGVLAYHSVIDESAAQKDKYYLPQTIPATMLIEHFNWLKTNGYNVVSWQQIIDAEEGRGELPDKAVLLSFDDGYETMYSVIYPLLQAYHYAAVFAPVTGWINAPANSTIQYGDAKLARSAFTDWRQIMEMQRSGLVEIASHTNDLHHGVKANPAGSSLPAVIAPAYQNGKYETEAQYQSRLQHDFASSADAIRTGAGKAPRVMVWPYGQFNETAVNIAARNGFTHYFSLNSKKINRAGDRYVGRLLLDAETDITTIAEYLENKEQDNPIQRVVHVDLDYLYDPNPVQQQKNFDDLIERIHNYGVTTVYLQAFADQDGNGVADALYFPNKYLPVKADLFSRVAWQLSTRTGVKVYAWMPVLAFDLRQSNNSYQYVTDSRTNRPSDSHYLRLSPYNRQNKEVIKSIYQDLAFYAKFNGILFHDDAFLTDFEGKPADSRADLNGHSKTADLIRFTDELKEALVPYFWNGRENLKTARNIYASLITEPEAEAWFAQNFVEFTKHYDTTAIMAMPYMENEQPISKAQAYDWFKELIQRVKTLDVNPNKVLFEFQAVNWRTQKPIDAKELVDWIKLLQQQGVNNFGYYPDNFVTNQPAIKLMKPYMSVNKDISK